MHIRVPGPCSMLDQYLSNELHGSQGDSSGPGRACPREFQSCVPPLARHGLLRPLWQMNFVLPQVQTHYAPSPPQSLPTSFPKAPRLYQPPPGHICSQPLSTPPPSCLLSHLSQALFSSHYVSVLKSFLVLHSLQERALNP